MHPNVLSLGSMASRGIFVGVLAWVVFRFDGSHRGGGRLSPGKEHGGLVQLQS